MTSQSGFFGTTRLAASQIVEICDRSVFDLRRTEQVGLDFQLAHDRVSYWLRLYSPQDGEGVFQSFQLCIRDPCVVVDPFDLLFEVVDRCHGKPCRGRRG